MPIDKPSTAEFAIYACPTCKRALRQSDSTLQCPICSRSYPIKAGIPDFILEDFSRSASPVLRRIRAIDRLAPIYETRLWYPIVLDVYGGFRRASLPSLVSAIAKKVAPIEGRLMDVACGPGTFGRRVASSSTDVYGIDISMGMLRKGAALVAAEGRANVHFARARVEALPFEDAAFDAALCCGSLHLFADTGLALREIARTMKPGAVLAVFTFTPGSAGLLRFRPVRERLLKRSGLHVFEIPEMEGYLTETGFSQFEPEVSGSVFTFSARRLSS